MSNEKVWILSDKNSKILTDILVRIYFAQEVKGDISIFENINDIDELRNFSIYFDNQTLYFAFENVLMAEFARRKCKEKGIIYIDLYALVYNHIAGLYSKLSKGDNIRAIIARNLEKNPIDFTVNSDDGANPNSALEADIVIIGVSRTSKTPLSIYMSNLGYKVTNIPLVPEIDLPREIYSVEPKKIFALTMNPERLVEIRKERLKSLGLPENSGYASLDRVIQEMDYSYNIIDKLNCKSIDVTHISIEETSEKIINYIDQGRSSKK